MILHSTHEDATSLNKYISSYIYYILFIFPMQAHMFYVNVIELLLRRFHIYRLFMICVFYVWLVVVGFEDTNKTKLTSHVCVCVCV